MPKVITDPTTGLVADFACEVEITECEPLPDGRFFLEVLDFSGLGLHPEDIAEDTLNWPAVKTFWSLLSPQIFSDHPKRPGDEDPSPPYNMVRNVLDMNARFGGFKSALLEAGKSVWVMNVVPTTGPNYHPLKVGYLESYTISRPVPFHLI
ncbi:hypothetical protein POM88_036577 [Heracleum sosnowskyi]|uniref:Methyltransferase n=1 Tax=Heracleum sosnowskyi TaxID=360622 RepID=A0AAD8MCH1_9APIA|nr:hypothetical protein POM88_036577 [Heracleum sosnowskyi]